MTTNFEPKISKSTIDLNEENVKMKQKIALLFQHITSVVTENENANPNGTSSYEFAVNHFVDGTYFEPTSQEITKLLPQFSDLLKSKSCCNKKYITTLEYPKLFVECSPN